MSLSPWQLQPYLVQVVKLQGFCTDSLKNMSAAAFTNQAFQAFLFCHYAENLSFSLSSSGARIEKARSKYK